MDGIEPMKKVRCMPMFGAAELIQLDSGPLPAEESGLIQI